MLAHLVWILWILFGWVFTRHRTALAVLHIVSLLWGVAVEVGPWPCPLAEVEEALEARAGATPYRGSFIVHYLDAVVYPNVPDALLTWLGGGVCLMILAIHGFRFWRAARARR